MKIRLWQLGIINNEDSSKNMLPTKATVEKFKQQLNDLIASKQEVIDLVWGPDIKCTIIDMQNEDIENYIVIDGKLTKVENRE